MEEGRVLTASEAAEYGEFKRARREAEVALTLRKLVLDASRREADKHAVKHACDCARKLGASSVLVSPVNVVYARRQLDGCETVVSCLVGGTGESLVAVKRAEARRAARQGAREIRLVLCYSALTAGNFGYLKKEIKRVRKAVKHCATVVSLEDHALGEEDVVFGVRAAAEAGADGVCVRGETALLDRAVRTARGKLRTDVSGVENAEQLRLLLKAGAVRAGTGDGERIAEEMYRAAETPPAAPEPLPTES